MSVFYAYILFRFAELQIGGCICIKKTNMAKIKQNKKREMWVTEWMTAVEMQTASQSNIVSAECGLLSKFCPK